MKRNGTPTRFVQPREIAVRKPLGDDFEILYSCETYVYHKMFDYPVATNGFLAIDIAVLKLKECLNFETSQNIELSPCAEDEDFPEG